MKSFHFLLGIILFFSALAKAGEPGSQLQFTTHAKQNSKSDNAWGPVLKDIMNHEAPGDVNNYSDLITLAHETSHGIHNYVRNQNPTPLKPVNAFYLLNDRAAFVLEPNMRKSQIAAFVPKILQGSRYELYVVQSLAWDDRALYIWDEWNAYVNGGAAGIDLVNQGLWNYGGRDAVMGPLEFTVYALATAMAVEQYDPNYFASYRQFTEFLAFNTKRAMEIYRAGYKMHAFEMKTQEEYYDYLKTHSDAREMREFCVRLWGPDWVSKVLGF